MLLFQQVALAAYACPLLETPSASHAAMPDCESMAMDEVATPDPSSALCHQDCRAGHAATPELRSPQAPAIVLLPLHQLPSDVLLTAIQVWHHAGVPACHADPPATQRFCRLLI